MEENIMPIEKLNVPTLRFPEFSGEWNKLIFGDIYTFRPTNSYSRENLNYKQGDVKNIHYGDIHIKYKSAFDIEKEEVPFINDSINISKIVVDNYCKEKDLIIADASEDYADIGKAIEIINLNNQKTLAGLHTILARPDKREIASLFGGYFMQVQSVRLQIKKVAQGAKVLGLSSKRLAEIVLYIPEQIEQAKIGRFLSLIDEHLDFLKKKQTLLESYKKGVMQKLFSQEIRFKDDNGNEYPEWKEKTIGRICNIKTGKLDANAMVDNGKYRFYTCAKDFFLIDNYEFDTDALLISGNGANVGYIHHYNGKFNAYQRTYVLSGFQERILFIKYLLEKKLKLRIDKEKKNGNTPYIVLGTLADMKVQLPKRSEQDKIANFLSVIDDKITAISDKIDNAEQYKKGLFQKIFV